MTVYMVIESKVKDPERYREYQSKVSGIIARYGGRYLARGNSLTPLSGGWKPERMILLEFPDECHIRDWLASPEYHRIEPLREAGADTRAVIVEGVVD
jgi:uncharacterized protein (DUF1330 family)